MQQSPMLLLPYNVAAILRPRLPDSRLSRVFKRVPPEDEATDDSDGRLGANGKC